MKLRFAVQPQGHLRVTEAWWALVAWTWARWAGATAVLRLDDLEAEAGRPMEIRTARQDLAWLGLDWDEAIHQVARSQVYAGAIDRLRAAGRLYPCFETPEELRAKHDRRLKRGQPTVYDRAMLALTPAQRAAAEAGGKRPYWRFLLPDGVAVWRDQLGAAHTVSFGSVSDPIVVRADGMPLRLLTSAIDDIDLGVTHALVVAGQDIAAAMEREIQAVLGADPDAVARCPIPVLECDGPPPTLRRLRNDGVEPVALLSHLAGWRESGAPTLAVEALTEGFSPGRLAQARPRFDIETLQAVNRRVLSGLSFEAVAARLPPSATAPFWNAVRGHVDLLRDAGLWWDVVAHGIASDADDAIDPVLRRVLRETMPPAPWSAATWAAWLKALPDSIDRDFAEPRLRQALIGETDGPPIAELLPLIGPERAERRLRG